MKLDDALATFDEEARELLEDMELQLLAMETGDAGSEAIHAVFRAAHTIKGSGGLFGFDALVGFTHHVESLIDLMRDGGCAASPALIGLLLRCGDHMGFLLAEALGKRGREATDSAREADLVHSLEQAMGNSPAVAPTPSVSSPPEAPAHAPARSSQGVWQVEVQFGADVFRNGLDPLGFLRYLGTLGTVCSVHTRLLAVPPLATFNAETCHLSCTIAMTGELSAERIASAFEFVRDDCTLQITAPRAEAPDYPTGANDATRAGQARHASANLAEAAEHAAGDPAGQVEHAAVAPADGEHGAEGVPEARAGREARTGESRFLRVEADKLDLLINLIGELVIAGASCSLVAQRVRSAEMVEATSTISTLVESIRDTALNLRMVQIGATFSRFQRVVRDLSQELGKEIELRISGAETELDKSVVEKIGDPLMHLVRNALDHGIESPEKRLAAGKPVTGVLQLHAYHESGSIVIEVGDDGGGLNTERIQAKAVERGLISEGANLSEREIHKLIFEPGFSTAEAVTNVSGRGVGMDVVRRNIEGLRGSIEVESLRGVGSTMRIRLPLTLAIIDGFLVGVAGDSYVVPLSMVVECLELRPENIEGNGERNYVNLRGEVLPFVRLRSLFEKGGEAGRRENIVVVRYAGRSAGLVVDELLGDFQTVIKPLGRLFGAVRGISGSTILGSGDVALILDVPSLIQLAADRETAATHAALAAPGRS